jgi:hypothetical protein
MRFLETTTTITTDQHFMHEKLKADAIHGNPAAILPRVVPFLLAAI